MAAQGTRFALGCFAKLSEYLPKTHNASYLKVSRGGKYIEVALVL